jgi:hypothetical protein
MRTRDKAPPLIRRAEPNAAVPRPTRWDRHVGEGWAAVLSARRVPRDGCVVEVGPGQTCKVGHGLSLYGFSGTLHVVEPSRKAAAFVRRAYAELLPRARIHVIERSLEEALPQLPRKLDAVLANHPLDDMIASAQLGPEEFQRFFADHYVSPAEAIGALWQRLTADASALADTRQAVLKDWLAVVDAVQPGVLAIAQYESFFCRDNGLQAPTHHAAALLGELKASLGERMVARPSNRDDEAPSDWLVAAMR